MMEIDDAFIRRVYKTSAYLWAFGVFVWICLWQGILARGWVLSSNWGLLAALGWTLGSAVSVGTLWSLSWIIRRAFVPGNIEAKRNLGKFSLVKLVVITLVLAGIVRFGGRSFALVGAFCAGVVLTQGVIFLKVLGMLICEHSNNSGNGGLSCTRGTDRH
jgi:hypothetical protein